MSKIIVTGSSGFIGTQLVNDLLRLDYEIIGIDLKKASVIHKNYTHLILDLSDADSYNLIPFQSVSCICHLAAKIRVDESMIKPDLYYNHNVTALIYLLNWMKSHDIKNFIFASTAAVYGESQATPIKKNEYGEFLKNKQDEPIKNDYTRLTKSNPDYEFPLLNAFRSKKNIGYTEEQAGNPISVYGRTKLIGEQILQDYSQAYGIKGYIFRFFNVCGGSESNHDQPIHLLPIIVNNIRNNKDINIYGTDYNTRDGTCLRDYIHLKDISSGFISGLKNGFDYNGFKIYNLGSGKGYTVREIIDKLLEKYALLKGSIVIKVIKCLRRPGDFDTLLANSQKVMRDLGWEPKCGLDTMITDTILSFDH